MSAQTPVLQSTASGLYCAAGGFHIDPAGPVERAIVTHAHADHARPGSRAYLCASPGKALLRERVGGRPRLEALSYGETISIGGARVSLHPAGHILGSAQIRVEVAGEVWVVSGDYSNTTPDTRPVCAIFEPVPCDTFITESTFALPLYRWPDPASVFGQIHEWWAANQKEGLTSVIPAYPLGKSQRLLAGLNPGQGPIGVLGNAANFIPLYREAGVELPPIDNVAEVSPAHFRGCGMVVTSAAASESAHLEGLGPLSWGYASGWMMLRSARKKGHFDRGFILSDHADWDGIIRAIKATGARRIGVTHGSTEVLARWLRENGWDAFTV